MLNVSEKQDEDKLNLNQIQELYDSEEEANMVEAKQQRDQRIERKSGKAKTTEFKQSSNQLLPAVATAAPPK